MKVVGFTIVKNAIKYDYPILESISSILPVCDEVIISVGKSEDDTLNLIKGISSPKIKIIESVWDDSLRTGGLRLAVETNKVKDCIPGDADWLFYIQADEVLHENGIEALRQTMHKYKNDSKVEGLLFKYAHFYGSYNYIVEPFSHWYNHEVRIVRNNANIRSFRDAQGFRRFTTSNPAMNELMNGGTKLKVKHVNATMCHYGWVKNPFTQKIKRDNFHEMWHDDDWVKKNTSVDPLYDYSQIVTLGKYKGTHPAVMQARIKMQDWQFSPAPQKLTFREKILRIMLNTFGWSIGEYKNYKLI